MKQIKHLFISGLLALTILASLLFNACEDDGDASRPTLTANSIEPSLARGGDTIVVNGSGFEPNRTQVEVLFLSNSIVSLKSMVLSATENQLTVIVPDGTTGSSPLTIKQYNGTESTITDSVFHLNTALLAPILTEIDPKNGYSGTVVTLTGENFGVDTSIINIYFGNTEAVLTGVGYKDGDIELIKTKVPANLDDGEHKVWITRNDTVSNELSFTVESLPVSLKGIYFTMDNAYQLEDFTYYYEGVLRWTPGDELPSMLFYSEDVTGIYLKTPRDLTIDSKNDKVFWCEYASKMIVSASLDNEPDGDSPEEGDIILSSDDGLQYPVSATIDAESHVLYFIMADKSSAAGSYTVCKYDLNNTATGIQTLYSDETFEGSRDSYVTVNDLVLNNGDLYWCFYSSLSSEGIIAKGNTAGSGEIQELYSLSETSVYSIAIDNANNNLYMATENGIMLAPLNGKGTPSPFIASEGYVETNAQYGLAFDAENSVLYWSFNSSYDNYIYRCAVDGTIPLVALSGVKANCIELDLE